MCTLFYAAGLTIALAATPVDTQARLIQSIRSQNLSYPISPNQDTRGQQQLIELIIGRVENRTSVDVSQAGDGTADSQQRAITAITGR